MNLNDIDIDQAKRTLLASSLKHFVKEFWRIVSPYPLLWARHLDALCEHLQGIGDGKVENLLVNFPPRFSKSTVVSVLFPVWLWLRDPAAAVLSSSYSMKLATKLSALSRQLVESPDFQQLFPHIQLEKDSNAKDNYKNTLGGGRLAVSIGSATTGFDATIIILDDAHSVQEKESETERTAAVDYFRLTLASRAIPGRTVSKIVVGQRVHQDDVSGYLLDNFADDPSWTFLILPFEYRPLDYPNAIGWKDWRTEPGECAWPEAYPPAKVKQLKVEHRQEFECLYNQDPSPPTGNLFDPDHFRYFQETETQYILGDLRVSKSACWRFSVVDLAIGVKSSNDYTVCLTFDAIAGNLILVDLLRERLDGTKLVPTLKAKWDQWTPEFVGVERVAFQQIVIDQLKQANVTVRPLEARGDKETRSIAAQIKVEGGQVWLPRGRDWVADFLSELAVFPAGKHDDQADCLAYAAILSQRYDRTEVPPTEEELEKRAEDRQREHFLNLLNAPR